MEEIQILWDYLHLNQTVERADVIIGFGCYDEDIPVRCAQLYHEGFAPYVAFSGGLGRNTSSLWTQPEAQRFGAIAEKLGVPKAHIILEDQSTNSAENLLFTPKVLARHRIKAEKIIAVHKPYMERRLYAAMQVYWPQVQAVYTSPQVSLQEHIAHSAKVGMGERAIIETIVGDLQRMKLYVEKGYQIPQEIPETVWHAYETLVAMGYDKQLTK